MNKSYQDNVSERLTSLLTELPPDDRESEMSECEAVATWYLNLHPSHASPAQFSEDLFSDPSMKMLVRHDQNFRLALGAETPSALVMNLLPSDGHLD